MLHVQDVHFLHRRCGISEEGSLPPSHHTKLALPLVLLTPVVVPVLITYITMTVVLVHRLPAPSAPRITALKPGGRNNSTARGACGIALRPVHPVRPPPVLCPGIRWA